MVGIVRSIPAQVAYSKGEESRQARRRIVSFAASMGSETETPEDVEVLDLSETGFRLRSGATVERGACLLIRLPGSEPVRARVVWCGDGMIGCAFLEQLHTATLDLIIGRKSGPWKPVQRRASFGLKAAG